MEILTSEKKQLPKWIKRLPRVTQADIMQGMVLILFGAVTLNGGAIAIKATAMSEPNWINLHLPAWICWIMMWIGFDSTVSAGKLTPWIMAKTLTPVIRTVGTAIVGEEKYNAFDTKMKRWDSKQRRTDASSK